MQQLEKTLLSARLLHVHPPGPAMCRPGLRMPGNSPPARVLWIERGFGPLESDRTFGWLIELAYWILTRSRSNLHSQSEARLEMQQRYGVYDVHRVRSCGLPNENSNDLLVRIFRSMEGEFDVGLVRHRIRSRPS